MSEFSFLSIQKKITKEKHSLYWSLFLAKKEGNSLDSILLKEGIDPILFGKVRFIENTRGVYVEHWPNHEKELGKHRLKCEMDIKAEWLMCFSFFEMKVLGLDMGVFEASASVSDALERLRWSEIADSHFDVFIKRQKLIQWLCTNAQANDRIFLCSDWMFYHPEGIYDYDFVTNYINNKIAKLHKIVNCPHWSKKPLAGPRNVQLVV